MTQTPQLLDHALPRIEAFIKERGISDATFGQYAVNDPAFVGRLREGRGTFRVAQRAIDYIAAQEASAARIGEGKASAVPPVGGSPIDAPDGQSARQMKVP